MKVNVLFFGATADAVGKRAVELDVAGESKSRAVFELVLAEHPSLESHKLLFALNQEYATGTETLKENDELALFTAVSGG